MLVTYELKSGALERHKNPRRITEQTVCFLRPALSIVYQAISTAKTGVALVCLAIHPLNSPRLGYSTI
jgi:hypothetical protein